MFRKLGWQLTTSYILVILCSMGILGYYMLSKLEDNFGQQLETSVRQQALLLASTWSGFIEDGRVTDREKHRLWQLAQRLSWEYGSHICVIDGDGKLLLEVGGTSEAEMAARPAIREALAGHEKIEDEPDPQDTSYRQVSLTFPILVRRPALKSDQPPKESVQGAVYVTRSTKSIRSALHELQKMFLFGTVISLLISGLLSLFMSYYITHPLRRISQAADRLARGKLDIQVPVTSMNEVGELADRFNYMARQLNASTGLLMEEKNKLAAVLANMADGVLMMDTKGNILVMNPSAVEMQRREVAAPDGTRVAERLLREGLVRAVHTAEELREEIPLAGGRVARAIYSPVRSDSGEVVGYVVILHDITELTRLAELKTEFVSNVSHELKTPLASIKGLAEILLDGALQEEDGRRFLFSIGREVDRMARLVRDLLNLSKIESGVVKMDVRPFDLSAVVREIAANLQTRAQGNNVRIEVKAGSAVWATGDPDRVEQVVVNLLDNALRYSPSDSTIRVDILEKDGMARVDVIDQGIGIPPLELERIFDRFYRVDKARTRERGGTGLGLSIARQIVDRLGGRMWAHSLGENKGSRFSFTLPLGDTATAVDEAIAAPSVSATDALASDALEEQTVKEPGPVEPS